MTDAKRVIAAKKENQYNTDAVPTLAANAILTRNFSSVPVEVDQVDRNLDTRMYGSSRRMPAGKRMRSTYDVELVGSGAAGTAPRWMELLEACGMALPTVVAATKVEQKFALPTAVAASLSEYHWVGDQLRKCTGQRGTFSLDVTAGQVPFASFQMMGLIPTAAPRAVAVPGVADFTAWQEPQIVDNTNSLFSFGGFAAVMRSLTINAGVNIARRNLVGRDYVKRGNHSVEGRIVIEAPSVAVKDYLANLEAGDLSALALTHGLSAGNILEVKADKVQVLAVTESDEDDELMFNIDLLFTTDGGSDDLLIIAR